MLNEVASGAFTHLSSGGAENAVAGRGGRLPEWRKERAAAAEEREDKGGNERSSSNSSSSSSSTEGYAPALAQQITDSSSSSSESSRGGSGGSGSGSVLEEAEAGVERELSRAREARDAAVDKFGPAPPRSPLAPLAPTSPSSLPSPWSGGSDEGGEKGGKGIGVDDEDEDVALTAASLLRAALGEGGEGRIRTEPTDWTGYRHRRAQALSDARVLRDAVSAAREAAEAEAGALRKKVERANLATSSALAEARAAAARRAASQASRGARKATSRDKRRATAGAGQGF